MKNSKSTLLSILFLSLAFIPIFVIYHIPVVFAGNLLKAMPEDLNGRAAASGSEVSTFWMATDTDGTFHAITLPTGTECKAVLIQVISSSSTTFDTDVTFHYSSTGNESTGWTVHNGGHVIGVGKKSGSLGYVRATAGYKVAVEVLY